MNRDRFRSFTGDETHDIELKRPVDGREDDYLDKGLANRRKRDRGGRVFGKRKSDRVISDEQGEFEGVFQCESQVKI